MFVTTFIFSLRGLITILLLTFFIWLLGDYPHWRAERVRNKNSFNTAVTATTAAITSVEPVTKETNHNKQKPIENLSLAHYILVSPFAAIYILGRAILDMIRYSLYFLLWWCEQSAPYIDDWLYDTVTIWLPKKYNAIESWWVTKGEPGFIAYKQHFKQETLPTLADHIELCCVKTYSIGCVMASSIQDFIHVWKRFTQRHDWHQLATDLGNIAYTVLWSPTIWIVTRSIRLGKLTFNGLRSAAISIRDDMIWIFSTLIPFIYNYLVSTRLVKIASVGMSRLTKVTQQVCLVIHEYLFVPTLVRFLTWLVKSIDQLILLLQDHSLQQKLLRMYRWTAPNIVWTLFEFSSIVTNICTGAHFVFIQLLYPAYILFVKRILPRLAIAYQKIIVQWVYELHIYPAWLILYPYFNAPLLWAYTNLTVPVLNGLYTLVASLSTFVTQHLIVKLQLFLSKVIKISMRHTQWVYSIIQTWLIKQAPLLSDLLQKLYVLMINSCDWDELKKDTFVIMTELYNWTSHQSNMMYSSLERSLSKWAKDQGANQEK